MHRAESVESSPRYNLRRDVAPKAKVAPRYHQLEGSCIRVQDDDANVSLHSHDNRGSSM